MDINTNGGLWQGTGSCKDGGWEVPRFAVDRLKTQEVVQSLSHVQFFAWTAAFQASLSFTISQRLLKLISIESVMSSNQFILCCPLLLLARIFPRIRWVQWVGSSYQVAKVLELQLQHQSFQWIFRADFLRNDWFDFPAVQETLKSLFQHHSSKASVLQSQPSLWSNFQIHTWLLEKLQLWVYGSLLAKWCLCFLIYCLGLS